MRIFLFIDMPAIECLQSIAHVLVVIKGRNKVFRISSQTIYTSIQNFRALEVFISTFMLEYY